MTHVMDVHDEARNSVQCKKQVATVKHRDSINLEKKKLLLENVARRHGELTNTTVDKKRAGFIVHTLGDPLLRLFLRHALKKPVEHGRATRQHDMAYSSLRM